MIKELKKIAKSIYFPIKKQLKQSQFQQRVNSAKKSGGPLRVVVGSSGIFENGWIPSEQYVVDLLDESTWQKYFAENEIDAIIAEHVWEHLSPEQGLIAAKMCFKYLKPGGYLRLAVPDGYHSNPRYIDQVKPGGFGAGSDDHKLLYNYQIMQNMLQEAGFDVKLLEYFDENRQFQYNEWSVELGKVRRSIRFDERNKNGDTVYTSLIADGIKPPPAG